MRKLYMRVCKRFCPSGMSLSALAWVVAQETGDTFWRDRIDGAWLLFFGSHHHCQASFQKERK
jgi:hypothetical protein